MRSQARTSTPNAMTVLKSLSTFACVLLRHSMFLKLDRNTCNAVLSPYYKITRIWGNPCWKTLLLSSKLYYCLKLYSLKRTILFINVKLFSLHKYFVSLNFSCAGLFEMWCLCRLLALQDPFSWIYYQFLSYLNEVVLDDCSLNIINFDCRQGARHYWSFSLEQIITG